MAKRADGTDDGQGDNNNRSSPAEVNAAGNRSRLSRIEEIGRVADGRRAQEMVDVDGERATGRFQGGEFDDSAAARERQAELANDEAEQVLQEQRERAQLDQEEEEREARRLQAEGGGEGGGRAQGDDQQGDQAGDEKVVDGVRYYLTIVNGQEKWLTLKDLRTGAAASAMTEETLQRAQEALQRASHAELSSKEAPAEVDDKDLENIVLSAGMGDEEAVRKLVSVLKSRPTGASPQEVSRLVSQQIATQREVDRAESAHNDLLSNELLAPIFRQRITQFAGEKPKTKIFEAYKEVGEKMRKDFAAMLKVADGRTPLSKIERKRTIVNPPQSAGRQQRREDEDREVPVAEQIDLMARARGQQRAHRVRRS